MNTLLLLTVIVLPVSVPYAQTDAPLVGGTPEPGWPAVGALTRAVPGVIYSGSFCSGTLVRKDWVLTAAHCVLEENGQGTDPRLVRFMVGDDARPVEELEAPAGMRFFPADAIHAHPQYDPQASRHDVALVHLAEPVPDVAPIPWNAEDLTPDLQGQEIFYVGFGVENGETYEGGGVKRSGWIPLWIYDDLVYMSEFMGTGVCFGDSGGPGLWQYPDGWRVIGVNSWVAGMGEDPCVGVSVQTRADAHAAWIHSTVAGGGPDCADDPSICWCPQACRGDGGCDDAGCETRTCAETLACALGCEPWDSRCRVACYVRAAPSQKLLLRELLTCLSLGCIGATIYDLDQACPLVLCTTARLACQEEPAGDGTCRDVAWCAEACPPGDGECRLGCAVAGTSAAQSIWGELEGCVEAGCAGWPVTGPEPSCTWDECSVHLETCLPSAECSPLGGGCPGGSACRESPTGALGCFASGGLEEGAACDPDAAGIPCANGLGCAEDGDGEPRCLPLCGGPGACGPDAECDGPASPVAGYGICRCTDGDGDGICAAADCDDGDPGVRPGHGERCWDRVDNDCDGEVDEGCPGPVEAQEPAGCGVGSGGGPWWWGVAAVVAWMRRRRPILRSGSP